MDSSKPQQFHPGPHSCSGSGSRDGPNAGAGSEPDLDGSVRASAPSAGNNQPELSPHGGGSSERKSSTGGEPREDDDMDISSQSTSKKHYEPESSKGKEKCEDSTTSEEETTLFQAIIDDYNENGTNPFADMSSARKFFDDCIKGPGVYADTQSLDSKMLELLSRILDKEILECYHKIDVALAIDPIDDENFRLSDSSWGEKDDEDHEYWAEKIKLDDHNWVNPNDSDGKSVDDRGGVNPRCSEDSYEQEIGDNRGDKKGTNEDSGDDLGHTKDTKDLKSLTEQESNETDTNDSKHLKDLTEQESNGESDTKDSKDPSEEETEDENDTEDSASSSSETSDGSDRKDSTDSSSFWLERKLMKFIRALMITLGKFLYGL